MKRLHTLFASSVALLTLQLALLGESSLADGTTGVSVQQLTPKPGQEITVKGDSLVANSQIEVILTGNGIRADLGNVRADANGDFVTQFQLPDNLEPGTYQLQAAGVESATTQLTVVGGSMVASSAGEMEQAPALRHRPLGQKIGLVAVFTVLAGLGIAFAQWRRRGAEPVSQ